MMVKNKGEKEIHIWAIAAHGSGLSGGDRIFIEFARRWRKEYPVTIYVWEEGRQMCRRQHLEGRSIKYKVLSMGPWCQFGFAICYFARILTSIREALRTEVIKPNSYLIYSASHFWMDLLPALILKLRYPKATWAAGWYQTAPNPLKGFSEGSRRGRHRGIAFLHWLVQASVKPLISRFADFVLINNEEEKKQFPKHTKEERAVIVLGAVPLDEINKYKSRVTNHQSPIFDAVFQGRFHPQKGVVELIDIWKKVVEKKPDAKLAMIGDGPLMAGVKKKITNNGLTNNVKLFGYVFDGPKKYKIFSQSRVVVHPAFYDSGGMASAEAMAFGLPAVGFNLRAYESYYPQGMMKVKAGDLAAFARAVLRLLGDEDEREKLGKQALEMIESNWSWDKRARETLQKILNPNF